MEWIGFVKKENVKKAEEILKKDFDVAAKESITVRDAKALNLKEDGSFFLISGSDNGVNHCKNLIKEFVVSIDEKILHKAKEEIRKEEEKAAEGFGGIFK
jgi:hypothetical protein